jgi:hypothetical protein
MRRVTLWTVLIIQFSCWMRTASPGSSAATSRAAALVRSRAIERLVSAAEQQFGSDRGAVGVDVMDLPTYQRAESRSSGARISGPETDDVGLLLPHRWCRARRPSDRARLPAPHPVGARHRGGGTRWRPRAPRHRVRAAMSTKRDRFDQAPETAEQAGNIRTCLGLRPRRRGSCRRPARSR